jgi:hypothetical protein
MCVRAAGRRSGSSREHPCAIRPAHPPRSQAPAPSIIGAMFCPNRRQAYELADSPLCPENIPIRAIIPFIHKGSLMFSWEHVVSSRTAFVEKGQRVVAETENLQIGVPLMRLPHNWSWALLAHDNNPHFPASGLAKRLFRAPGFPLNKGRECENS